MQPLGAWFQMSHLQTSKCVLCVGELAVVPATESKAPHRAGKLLPRNAAAEDLRLDNMLAAK